MTSRAACVSWLSIPAATAALPARAQQAAGGDPAALAQALSNPVAALVSVPFQFNWEQGVGYQDATRMVLNVQPVVPFTLNDDWNLIGRWIMPFVSPAVSLPTTDDPTLGSDKWAAGPTIVMLKQSGPWTYGFLANQLWSFADASDADRPDVNKTFLQPFLAYARPSGVTFSVNSEATYDREADDGDEWTFPVNVMVSKVTRFGALAASSANAQQRVAELVPGLLPGYLSGDALPDSLALLPAPPADGSAAFALDEDVARKSVALRGGSRWTLATLDADLSFPNAAGTPRLYMLLRKTLTDAGLSTYGVKNRYQRPRPFTDNNAPICTAAEQTSLAKDGSYPSGHTAVGWAWALILSELAPERADAILARGLAYGESRNVCNVHWHSDVVEGRVMGAAIVARLHADLAFRADMEAAKAELAVVLAGDAEPSRDCAAEAAALSPRE